MLTQGRHVSAGVVRPQNSTRSVLPENASQRVGDLAEGRKLREGLFHRVEKVLRTLGRTLEVGKGLFDGAVVPALPELGEPFGLPLADGLVDGVELHVRIIGPARGVAIDPDDNAFLSLDLALVAVGGLLDLTLHKALLDGLYRASHPVDAVYVRPGFLFDSVGKGLDVVGACKGVGRPCKAALARQDLLGTEGDAGATLRRKREGLVEGVGVQALGPAEDRGERLDRGAHHVVLGLLGRQRGAGGLGVEPELAAPLVGRAETLAHDGGPHPPRRPVFGDLLKQVVVGVEEEREPWRKLVHLEPGVGGGLDVGYGVREGESELLDGGGPGLPDVVAADRDGVPARHLRGTVGEHVRRYPHRWPRRVDVGATGQVLLEYVVLGGPREDLGLHALLFGDKRVQEQQDRSRRVYRHRGRDLPQGNALQEVAHVQERVDGHTDFADLARCELMVGITPHLRGQVEGHGEAGLAVVYKVLEAGVRLTRRAESRILAHGPWPAAIHARVRAAGVRVLSRVSEPRGVVEAFQVVRLVEGRDLDPGLRAALVLAFLGVHGVSSPLVSGVWQFYWLGEHPKGTLRVNEGHLRPPCPPLRLLVYELDTVAFELLQRSAEIL